MIQVVLFAGYFINNSKLGEEVGLSHASDEEILSVGFEKWGTSFFPKLNGLFAFVLYEKSCNRYYCCRDRFGGKGLYYTFDEGNTPIFSENIQDLLRQTGQTAAFREDMLEIYLSYSYIPGEDTAFVGVWKPLPGYYYRFDGEKVWKERYFLPQYHTEEHTADEWKALLAATLDAVCSGKETGGASLLSSGIDSSYLCKTLAIHNTYTATYAAETDFSEAELAGTFSASIGACHHALEITPEAYLASVPEAMRAVEQPTGDASVEVLLHTCRCIRKDTDSCYSGEGIDEFFLGYYMNTVWEIPEQQTLFDAGYIGSTSVLTEEEKQLFLKHYTPTRKMEYTREAYDLSRCEDKLHQAAMVDLLVWLNGNLLPNIFGIERTTGLRLEMPYLDNRLYDIAMQIPSALKYDTTLTKKIFRMAAGMVLGNEMMMRPKRGFPVPVRLWLRRPDYVKKIKQAFMSDTAFRFFNRNELIAYYDKMLADPADRDSWRAIWCVYCFIVWYDEMVNPYQSVQRWQVYDPQFNQNEAWSEAEYPDATLRYMRQAGCLVVSLATLLRLHGLEREEDAELFNPWIFNNRLKQMQAFTPASDLNLDVLQDIYPLRYSGEEAYTPERLAALMEANQLCLIRVPGAHAAFHYVVPVRMTPHDVEIIDSGWDYGRLSAFAKVFSIVRFDRVHEDAPLSDREKIIQRALSYLGIHESYPDANDVVFNTHYYGHEISGSEYPWCVAFIWDIFRECGLSSLFYDGKKTASCIQLYQWAQENGRIVDSSDGQRGDIVLYDWYNEKQPVHIGIILGLCCEGYYRTIEGNTSKPSETNACGSVMVRKRRFGGVFAIIRPNYDGITEKDA